MELLTAERATGGWYTNYVRYPFYGNRSFTVRQNIAGAVILVAGCGFGYLVDQLVTDGRNVWGLDASAYAISEGQARLPAIANRLRLGSVLLDADLVAARQAAGLRTTGNPGQRQLFDLCITEDLLPCLTDAEIATALPLLRTHATRVAHIVTPLDPTTTQAPEMNWKTFAQWDALIGSDFLFGPNGEGPL